MDNVASMKESDQHSNANAAVFCKHGRLYDDLIFEMINIGKELESHFTNETSLLYSKRLDVSVCECITFIAVTAR